MALRGGSSFLRSLARLSNVQIASSSRLPSEKTKGQKSHLNASLFGNQKGFLIGEVRRLFSTTPKVTSVSADLSDALKQEIDAEKDLVEKKEAEVRLTKKHENESILVVFNVNHSVDIADEAGEGEQEPPAPVALPPFTIEITKGEERLCFHLELVETDQQGEYDFQVEEFYIAPAVKNNDEDVPSHVYATSGKYIDPSVQELLYVRYLEERGFDGAFLKNLVEFASAHEHKLYIDLLNKMKAFIAK